MGRRENNYFAACVLAMCMGAAMYVGVAMCVGVFMCMV